MDWVERPWTVRSPDQLYPDWRAALDRYEARSQPWAPRIFVPLWKRDKRNKAKESAWFIADRKDGLSVLEKPHDREFVFHQIPYRAGDGAVCIGEQMDCSHDDVCTMDCLHLRSRSKIS